MSNSSLVTYRKISPNKYSPRKYPISRFTIHHMAWVQCTSKKCADTFANARRSASSTYCIGYDGDIAQCVDEKDAPWTSSNYDNDNRAITFEVANSTGAPNWKVSDKSYKALINLMVDCCKRNGKTKVIWFGDKEKSLAYKPAANEMLMTVHQWFSATLCPGPYLYSKMGDIANEVNKKLANGKTETPKEEVKTDDSNEHIIWTFFKSKGLNDYAVAGIMGNLKAESNLRPNNLQNSFEKKLNHTDVSYTQAVDSGAYKNFAKDGAGYGLAQWTFHTRKSALLAFAKEQNLSIGSLQMQLDFMWQEMQSYTGMMNVLREAHSILEASNAVLFSYERPADQSKTAQDKRYNFAKEFYNIFANGKKETAEKEEYAIQIGAFGSKSNAEKRINYLKQIGITNVFILEDDSNLYKVRTMAISSEQEAKSLLGQIKNAGFDAFII